MKYTQRYIKIYDLLEGIKKGKILIPYIENNVRFWSLNETTLLLDSILKGYPIGQIILWKCKSSVPILFQTESIETDEYPTYVLDGRKRACTLFYSLYECELPKGIETLLKIDFDKKINYNLSCQNFTQSVGVDSIPLIIFFNDISFDKWVSKFTRNIRSTFFDQLICTIDLITEDYETGLEIYKRFNLK
jgi:hypothetical protein